MQPSSIPLLFWIYTALLYRSTKLSNFLVSHTSSGISSGQAAFLFLIFASTTSRSSGVNCSSFMFT